MLKKVLKGIYLRIHISKYLSCLQSLKELYVDGNMNDYLRKMEILYSNLQRFPQLYYKDGAIADSPLNRIYSSHADLFLKIDHSIRAEKANDLNNLSDDLTLFLHKLYDAAVPKIKRSKRYRSLFSIAGLIALIFLFGSLYSFLKERYFTEKVQYETIVMEDVTQNEDAYKQKTINDVLDLKKAIQNYYNDHKSYPKSSGGWDAINAAFGTSKEEWIPGLTPKYIKELPVDPRRSKDSRKQYMYKSDGRDFKLVAHNPVGINDIIKNRPELVDPVRPSWAFGVWSEGGKNW